MMLERFKADGLAHLSYLIADGGEAAVIDPQRDIEPYLAAAERANARIRWIFETHRNEDFVTGAGALAARTGAETLHGPDPAAPIEHARPVTEGETVEFGQVRLEVLETPGHTDDSLSIVLTDTGHDDGPVAVFTGDALFIGDVGRTDFYPDRAREVAGLLFDSLRKLLALGDQCLIYPAHGAGSVCGNAMADREFSSIGHERRNNPMLQCDRDAFIAAKLAEHHYQPPYFRLMEARNLGHNAACVTPGPVEPMEARTLQDASDRILDIRSITAYLGGHLPGSQSLPADMIAAFAGWFLGEEDRIGLVCDTLEDAETARITLYRLGFEHVTGACTGVVGEIAGGSGFDTLPAVDTGTVAHRLAADGPWTLLDVRSLDERESGHIAPSRHAYAGEVLQDPGAIGLDGPVTVMCASGARATLAASALKAAGYPDVDVYLGSMGAWQAAGKPVAT